MDSVIEGYPVLVGNLKEIAEDHVNFDSKSRAMAKGLADTLTDRDFVQLLFFITDVSKAIKTTSLRMQARDGLLTEQHNQMTTLVSTIQLMAGRDGEYSARLLAESQCSLSDDERGCTNEDFENSEEVSFKGFQLKHRHNSRYKPLSELRFGIVTALETELKKYFPEHEFGDFKVLRPQTFPKDLAGVTFHGIAELPNLARYVCTTSHEYPDCWPFRAPS